MRETQSYRGDSSDSHAAVRGKIEEHRRQIAG